jgi:Flp pilus assembly protein TadG
MKALLSKLHFRCRKGQTTVEFALAAIILLALLFAIIDLSMMFFVNLTMQHAVREGVRYAITGRSNLGADRRAALIAKIKEQSMGLYDRNLHVPKDPTIKVIPPSSVTFPNYTGGTTQTGDPGQADETIVVSLTYKWSLVTPLMKPFFPGGAYTFTVKATMKNEPFPATGG